ncbi:MAG: hypothetical protein KDD55_13210, partial [Bdellovibrionales bacterium]|nr:hypothetical protein [Bdellovibrionales bacterium]
SILLFLCYSGRIWTLFSPLLFLVWANIHAGALLGAIVHFSFFINDRQATPARRITFFALSGIALLCNPSGLSLVTYPLQYAFSSNGDFSLLREWQSPLVSYSFQELAILLAPLFLGLIACILAFVRSKNRTEAFLFLLTFAMGMKSERFIPFAAMFLPFILLSVLPESEKRLSVRIEALLSFILLGCASLYTFSFPFHPSAFAYMVRQEKIPVVMCQFLREQNLNGNVFARYALAAHIPYCTNGNLKVFIDGRADTIYPPEIFSLYRSIYNLTPGWEKQLNDSHTDYVLWTKKGAFLSALQQSTDWELLFEDHISYLFRRKGAYPNLSPFTPTGPYAALSRAIAMSSKHLYKKAEEALLSAASEHFPAPEICRTHAKLIAYQNRFEEAYEKLQECQKLYPYPSRLQLLEETEKRLRKYEPWYGRVDFPSITLY